MKLATGLPTPPKITEEVRLELYEEAKEWREIFQKKIDAMRLTSDDWRVIVR